MKGTHSTDSTRTFIGTAAWTVPAQYAASFDATGSHLERYASRFNSAAQAATGNALTLAGR